MARHPSPSTGNIYDAPMRVALVHECIAGYHGSERVLAALAGLYPDAPIYTLIHQRDATAGTPLEPRDHRTSFLDRLPVLRNHHRLLLPWMPYAVEQHDLRGFDVVISSHHAVAHGALTRADQMHVCYTHSPARYAWDLYPEHVPPGKLSPIKRRALHRFRTWDQCAAQRVDHYVANSNHVARRIAKVYRRNAEVVHPPVDVARFKADAPRGERYVALGRLVPYKRTDVVVRALNELGRPLTVLGDGPELHRLRSLASGNVTFVTDADDAAVAETLATCRALVFAGEEDFGIGLVEAQAAGAPVIAWRRGGAGEIVEHGVTGVLFEEPTPAGVQAAVEGFESAGVSADAGMIRAHAERFSADRFADALRRLVTGWWERFADQGPPIR